MARKNQEVNGDSNAKSSIIKNPNAMYFMSISTPKKEGKGSSRLSPSKTPTSTGSPGSSPRTSPGLLAGYYAGCKWSEPPLPSALPRPPQHWMPSTSTVQRAFHVKKSEQPDISYQLKVLLNVQA